MPLGVLMVTGAYPPEVSGGGVQCRELVRTLKGHVNFIVLTTCTESSLPEAEELDGVPVYRVLVDVTQVKSKLKAAIRLASTFAQLRRRFDVVHFHGFSRKTILLTILAKLFRKTLLLTLHTSGYDEPRSIRSKGRLAFWCYSQADLFFGVSPRLQELYNSSELPRDKFRLIPNGVDLECFRPADQGEQRALRRELGLPAELALILFVGFFSREKHPDLLFEAWTRMQEDGLPATGLVFVGATRSRYHEVDPALAQKIRAEAKNLGLEKQVIFIEVTHEIEKFYRAADLFVLSSSREGLPLALLEAMASGLPCVTSRLQGVTDVVIEDGVNGILFPPGDAAALEGGLRFLLQEPTRAQGLGKRARETVAERFSIKQTAACYLEAYRCLTGQSTSGYGGANPGR